MEDRDDARIEERRMLQASVERFVARGYDRQRRTALAESDGFSAQALAHVRRDGLAGARPAGSLRRTR